MKHLHDSKSLWAALALFLALPGLALLGQEEEEGGDDAAAEGGDAGGGSAAEAAVTTGGTSQPAAAASGSIESNPIVTAVRAGVPLADAIKFTPSQIISLASQSGSITDFIDFLEDVVAGKVDLDSLSLTSNGELLTAIQAVKDGAKYTTNFQTALESAVGVADAILTDKTITSVSDLPTALTAADLASGHNTELIRLLSKYGAIGPKGDDVAAAFFGTNYDYAAFTGSASLTDFLGTTTSEHVGHLNGALGTRTLPTAVQTSSVLKVSMSNVTLAPAANIAISSDASIDVSGYLGAAASASDRKVYVLGAAKDLTIAGDVTFTNTNTAEDHALVIGAADDLYFRSEYSSANNADYSAPDPVTVKYEGSNLGIGSYDTMRLVNVNMETGGNLALGTLNDLHIGLSDGHSSTFTVGNGGNNPDNVYLYANELISINGLQFSGNVDDVYMDAITIDLSNVTFPQNSDVMLRSRDGTATFGSDARAVGSVNFIKNVKYGTQTLEAADFSGSAGHINTYDITLPNGKPAIKVRGF